jgi:hypothetical protein
MVYPYAEIFAVPREICKALPMFAKFFPPWPQRLGRENSEDEKIEHLKLRKFIPMRRFLQFLGRSAKLYQCSPSFFRHGRND